MQLTELRSQVRGQVLLPGDDAYDVERTGWNRTVEHHPAMIVSATCEDDVVAAVRFAASEGLPMGVQATGHGASIPMDGALLLNTRRMTGIAVDSDAATARIGAGVRGGKLMDATAPDGLAPLVASTPDIGMVGYQASGGLPMLGRRYGFAADHVRAVEMVTADGQLRRVTADVHPDLFWAVRGGKDNFGVVTAMETGLVPETRFYGGGLYFSGDRAGDVLRGWLEWNASLPEELCSSSLALRRFPDLPVVPEPMRGQFLVHVRVVYTGLAAEGERLLRSLRARHPVIDAVADVPHGSIGSVHSDPPGPAPVRAHGILLRDLDDAAVERILDLAGPDAALPPGQVEFRLLGGALARAPETPNAISHRDAAFGINVGMLVRPGDEVRVAESQQALFDGLQPWSTGGTLPNYLGSGAIRPDQVRAAYSDVDYERLTSIKAVHDPGNLFRINHNIPPAA